MQNKVGLRTFTSNIIRNLNSIHNKLKNLDDVIIKIIIFLLSSGIFILTSLFTFKKYNVKNYRLISLIQ